MFPRQVQGLALSLFQLEFSPLKVPLSQHHTVGASLISTSAHLPWIFELSNGQFSVFTFCTTDPF